MRGITGRSRSTILSLIGLMLLVPPAEAQGLLFGRHRAQAEQAVQPPTVEDVGRMIDELDRQLFALGTINVKAPDVWGQNRMTKYRADFEKEMAKDVGTFKATLNGAQRRADLAVLISSTSIGAALNPGSAASAPTLASVLAAPAAGVTTAVPAAAAPTNAALAALPSTLTLPSQPSASTPVPAAPDTNAQIQLLSQRLDNLEKTNLLQFPQNLDVALEPTVVEAEKANYLNYLNELRRINAGDDLTDAPGYGLYLIRMPVSLLPGPAVAKGKGALINVEARHILPPDLLANTFRSVAIMDTTYQLDPLLLKILHGVLNLDEHGLAETRLTDVASAQADAPPGVYNRSPGRHGFGVGVGESGAGVAVAGAVSLSESWDLYGYDVLKVLVDAVNMDRKDWYVHDASLLSWLINELATAHRFMREQARNGRLGYLFSPAKFQELDQIIQDRNYTRLSCWRSQFLVELVLLRTDHSYDPSNMQGQDLEDNLRWVVDHLAVTDVLVYALMVQSVMVDRQLKHDIDITAQRKGCACPDLGALTFFDLFPTPEAQAAFNAYVARKWPIHVFSLDPFIDQQNELDLFSARSELQVALAVALASGTVNFNNATSYARQLQTDLETINLNRTAVGYGAGDTTFGWRFYPRIQSPPTQNNIQRIGGLLLGTNYSQNYMERNRRIEPGLRECVAMVVTPNFIPAIRFTTSANWFDLEGHHQHQAAQQLATGDVLRLSHQVQATKEALAAVCDAGHYRPGEVERLADRLAQLEAQLPLQYYRVPLPFEGDLTGSEIFTSEDSQLAPRLLAWYGEPPQVGAISTIYLLGTNFSVSEYDVIVGGVRAADIKLMSRNVMRVTLNGQARPKKTEDGRLIFDIHTASPNGISNHLFAEATPAPKKAADGGSGYSISPASFDVTVMLGDLQQQRWCRIATVVTPDTKLVITLKDAAGILPPAISPEFAFPSGGNQALEPYKMGPIGFNQDAGGYLIDADHLNAMAHWVVTALDTAGQIAPGKIPIGVDSKPIKITPIIPAPAPFIGDPGQIKAGIKINLKFRYEPPKTNAQGVPAPEALPQRGADVPPAPPSPEPVAPPVMPPGPTSSRAPGRRPTSRTSAPPATAPRSLIVGSLRGRPPADARAPRPAPLLAIDPAYTP